MINFQNIKTKFSKKDSVFQLKTNQHFLAIIIIGITALLCSPLSNTQTYYIVSFILLFVVSFMATFMRTAPVLLASSLSALVWNFFFIPPRNTFHIDKAEDILMFVMFFIIALLNGILTTRVRKQEQLAREREKRTNALFQLTKELSKARGINEVIEVAEQYIGNYFQLESFFILQNGDKTLDIPEALKKEKNLSEKDCEKAQFIFSNNGTKEQQPEKPYDNLAFFSLSGAKINPGIIAVKTKNDIKGDKKIFWDTCLTQISNALEREFLGELAQKVRFLDESDKLYKTLFNSISHELRIPVATILGSADTLLTTQHPENIQQELHAEIFTASLRLNRLIENLLNMSRLESGRISVRPDWCDLNDLINKVATDLHEELKPFQFNVSLPEDIPLIKIDFGLMEQVLYNLLFNATEYAPESTEINLKVSHKNNWATIDIMDQGPGFPEIQINQVFKKFFRVDGSKTGGLGLGLSIVKGFTEAHNGTVSVKNRKEGGACFSVNLPIGEIKIENIQQEEP